MKVSHVLMVLMSKGGVSQVYQCPNLVVVECNAETHI
jgi:hypothetical protein